MDVALDTGVRHAHDSALTVSLVDAALYALMVGVSEKFFGAFAVELGHGEQALGLLSSVPVLAGAAAQLSSPLLRRWGARHKPVCIAGALGQALSLVGLIAIAALQSASIEALLGAEIAYFVALGVLEPPWHSWMAELTRQTDRARYFARRSMLFQLALLLGFSAAGSALEHAGARTFECYVALFSLALLARLGSIGALALQTAPEERARPREPRGLSARLRQTLALGKHRVVAYLACVGVGAAVAAPFITPYLLRELELDYRVYTSLTALTMLTKGLAFLGCRRLGARLGQRGLLVWGGAGTALLPILWATASSGLAELALVHALTGVVWAATDHAGYQLLLRDAPTGRTAEFFALSNATTAVTGLCGATLGGILLGRQLLDYPSVFALSALLCLLPLGLLRRA